MGIIDGLPGEALRLGQLDELAGDECCRLLASRPHGRVGFTGRDGPQVLPVNHVVLGGDIYFRCAAYSDLARDVCQDRVAFEVDLIDDETRTGWSVLVVGRAEAVNHPDDLVMLWAEDGPHPSAPGTRTLHVRITPQSITGRRIVAA